MRKLRVAIVAPSLRFLGGQSIQAQRLLTHWSTDPDVDAWLVPHDPVPFWPLSLARRVKYVRTAVTEATYLPLLVRELRRADLVHVFSASYASFLLAPVPAVAVARALGKPVVLNYRSGEAPDHLRRSRLARRVIAAVDRNVVPSQFLVDVFAEFGIPALIVPNIVDLSQFRFRARMPLTPRILSTRNFDDLYNVACTVRAFRLVQDRRPDATLTLVGGGPNEAALRALVAELGLSGVTFTGRVPPGEIAKYYEANDIYLQSPDIDNMPASLIEAFASGLPVVSTKAGGIPAILADGQQGLLAPLDDHEGLASRVVSLLADPLLARRLAEAAHVTCSRYTWSAVREQWLRVYLDVLPRTATHRRASQPSSPDDHLGRPVRSTGTAGV
jgi:glycosyltransferase involved in cell wall biosynthesis